MHIHICMLHLQSYLEWGVPIEIENPAAHNRRCQSDGVGERQKCGGFWCWGKSCKKCCISQGELPQRVKTKRVCVLDHVEFVSVALVATKLRHSVQQRLVSRWTNEKVKEIPTKKKQQTHPPAHETHTPAPIQKQTHAQGVCCAALAAADEDDHQIQSQRQRQTDINGSSL